MKCPSCGAAQLIEDTRDLPCRYAGETAVIPAVKGGYCDACGEVVLDAQQGDRYSRVIGEFMGKRHAESI
ncbi:MAG: type II toxin-antitoxin system MqsA family antitoxin [Betaproteobacteria bacterium]